jgi:hypothetical protein
MGRRDIHTKLYSKKAMRYLGVRKDNIKMDFKETKHEGVCIRIR